MTCIKVFQNQIWRKLNTNSQIITIGQLNLPAAEYGSPPIRQCMSFRSWNSEKKAANWRQFCRNLWFINTKPEVNHQNNSVKTKWKETRNEKLLTFSSSLRLMIDDLSQRVRRSVFFFLFVSYLIRGLATCFLFNYLPLSL